MIPSPKPISFVRSLDNFILIEKSHKYQDSFLLIFLKKNLIIIFSLRKKLKLNNLSLDVVETLQ